MRYSYLIVYENGERTELDDEHGLIVKYYDGTSYKLLRYWIQ